MAEWNSPDFSGAPPFISEGVIAMKWNKFVLYCHISPDNKNDLLRVGQDVKSLLKEHHCLLVLFVDTGLPDLLKMIHPIKRDLTRCQAREEKQKLKKELYDRSSSLKEGETFGRELESGLKPNVRVLTALDVFGEMSSVEDLRKFLIGMENEIRYDTPKFIESIVRLRMIGSRVPVLRLDRDVLIPPDGKFHESALALAITQICEGVLEHHDRTQVLATILSANYETPKENSNDVMAWNRGYATRILPSLLVPNEEDAKKYISLEKSIDNWELEMMKYFRTELTRRFYERIWKWGAPTTAAISGALLYMNGAVVLNVPPFSNFSQRVMWIDDHLRYVLHREMGDFCRRTQTSFRTNEPLNVQYSIAKVPKYRKAQNFLLYTIETYLLSLLWGSFFDCWLCPSPLLKRREDELSGSEFESDKKKWREERQNGCPGILATAVREARAGCLPGEALLRENLKEKANERLEDLLKEWGELKNNGEHRFASAWVHGKFPEVVKNALSKVPEKLPGKVEEFEKGLKDGFHELLDDTCRYVRWVFEWPRVVSVIRSVPPGEFRSDLEWDYQLDND